MLCRTLLRDGLCGGSRGGTGASPLLLRGRTADGSRGFSPSTMVFSSSWVSWRSSSSTPECARWEGRHSVSAAGTRRRSASSSDRVEPGRRPCDALLPFAERPTGHWGDPRPLDALRFISDDDPAPRPVLPARLHRSPFSKPAKSLRAHPKRGASSIACSSPRR